MHESEVQPALATSSEPPDETIVSRLRARCEEGNRSAFVFLLDGEEETAELSFAELDERARAVAAALRESVSPGARALLLLPPGLDFIAAFYGCLYAGVIAVPAYPPDPWRLGRTLPRLQAIARDADVAAVLSHSAVQALLGDAFQETRRALPGRWIATDQIESELGGDWSPPVAHVDAVAFLQYTSGSTSLPKGVALSHGNLMQQASLLERACFVSPQSRVVSWLPPYHDMGLVSGVLMPVFAGVPGILLSPVSFLQRPSRWLHAISRHRGTHNGAPNFGYELAVRKTTEEEKASLDLSSWETAACGAEPISAGTMERFLEAFRDQGLRREAFAPCYGLAEATLMVTIKPHSAEPRRQCFDRERLAEGVASASRDADGNSRELVACGVPDPETRVRIVDPQTCVPLREGGVGEIWVANGSVALGYWDRPEETRATFGARLAGSDEGPFLRTGDLGFIQDGDLFVTGRIKDLMIIRGRNLHPEDVEQVVERCHPALRPGNGAAFSVWEDEEERLALVYEIHRRYHGDLDEVVTAMRSAVSESHQVAVHAVALIEARTIPKTSSGKIQRHACRRALEEGSLDVLQEWRGSSGELPQPGGGARAEVVQSPAKGVARTASEIEAWLVEHIAEQLSVDPGSIDRHCALTNYGLDSLFAVSIAADLEHWLGRPVRRPPGEWKVGGEPSGRVGRSRPDGHGAHRRGRLRLSLPRGKEPGGLLGAVAKRW
jgi:acyl-CoA synthetase (AMP-forming)/AMP-acid ligase II